MKRYLAVIVIVTVVAAFFNQRYQTQRERNKLIQELAALEEELSVQSSDIDDYCDTICRFHQCERGREGATDGIGLPKPKIRSERFGLRTVDQSSSSLAHQCLCFDRNQKRCQL